MHDARLEVMTLQQQHRGGRKEQRREGRRREERKGRETREKRDTINSCFPGGRSEGC